MKTGNGVMFALVLAMIPAALTPAESPAGGGVRRPVGDVILGARAGYAMFAGPYGNAIRGSYSAGASLSYGNRGIVRFLSGEVDFSYARHPMRESKKSYLQSFSASLGPVITLPVTGYIHPYAGISFRASYFHLYAENSRKNVKSFKPGLLARVGAYIPIARGLMLRAGADYSLEYLSGKPLHGLQFTGGVAYNFNPERSGEAGVVEDRALRVDRLIAMAAKALRAGMVEEARERYREALELDPGRAETAEALRAIEKAEADFARALALSKVKRYYEALALLDGAGGILPGAKGEQKMIRGLLAGEVTVLERNGIDLYEKGDYRGCIATMKRLLLIDPDNRTGRIYMPRAQKRQEALERLR